VVLARPVSANDSSAPVLHHTAGSNSYSQAQAVSQLRGVYAYHTRSLGWSDIGYNLVVDRYGTIYEGRRGSITSAPQGAHAGGFNRDTYGVSVLGNFVGVDAPSAVTTALNAVIGWKLGQYGTDPRGTSRLVSAGGGTSRWPAGTAVTVDNVMGHRDVGRTSCPGNLYALLPVLRSAAAPRTTANLVDAFPKDVDADRDADLLVIDSAGRLDLYAGRGDGTVGGADRIGSGWAGLDLVTNVGDWNGDAVPDVLARDRATGRLYLYAGRNGVLGAAVRIGTGWSGVDQLLGVGDLDQDGDPDLVALKRSDRTLWAYRGDGAGGFEPGSTRVTSTMRSYDAITAVGDLDGGGDPDLLARRADSGRLYRLDGNGTGGFGDARVIGTGWSRFDALVGVGDMDGAGGPDLVARARSGRLYLYRGTREGSFSHSTLVGRGWAGVRFVG